MVAKYVQLINNFRLLNKSLNLDTLKLSTQLAGQAKLDAIGVAAGHKIPGLIYYTGARQESLYAGVAAMLDQRFDYRYRDHTCRSGEDCMGWIGLMCRGATEVGCARLETDNGSVIIACRVDNPCDASEKTY